MDTTQKVSQSSITAPCAHGWLDRLDPVDGGVNIEGWAFKCYGDLAIFPKLIVTSDWSIVQQIERGNVSRLDVENAYPNFKFESDVGFSIFLSSTSLSLRGIQGIQVFVVNSDGTFSQLKTAIKRGLQVELIGRCNLTCPMCPSVIHTDFHKKEFLKEDLPSLISFLQDRNFICLDGFGESLLSPIFEQVLDSLPRASEVVFHTNGLLLNKKMDSILKNSPPVNWIAVSLDSLNPEKYARLRAGSTLTKVIDNLRLFKKTRDSMGLAYPIIRLNLTLMKENYEELEGFVRASKDFDSVVECNWLYDAVNVSEGAKIDVDGVAFDYDSNEPKHLAKVINNSVSSAFALAKQLGVEIIFNSCVHDTLREEPDENGFSGAVRSSVSDCPHLQGDFMIQADGKVQNCVWQTTPIFDWRSVGFKMIKTHPRIEELKSIASMNKIPYECSGAGCCYVGRQISQEPKIESQLTGGYSGKKLNINKTIKIKKNTP